MWLGGGERLLTQETEEHQLSNIPYPQFIPFEEVLYCEEKRHILNIEHFIQMYPNLNELMDNIKKFDRYWKFYEI